jgi:hypothetical protein
MNDGRRLAMKQLDFPPGLAPEPIPPPIHPSARPSTSRHAADRPGAGKEHRLSQILFRSTAAAPLRLVVRLWLGYEWFSAGWQKLHGTGPASWFGDALGGDRIIDLLARRLDQVRRKTNSTICATATPGTKPSVAVLAHGPRPRRTERADGVTGNPG